MKSARARTLTSSIAAFCTLALLAACGSDGAPATEGDSTSPGGAEAASDYPDKAIRLIAPAAAGGGYDTTARTLLSVLQGEGLIDVAVTVENREGADGSVWLAEMATTLAGHDEVVSVGGTASMYNDMRGETQNDFYDVTPIASLMTESYAIVVPADSEFETLKDVVDAVLADPGSVPIGGGSLDRAAFDLVIFDAGGDPKASNFVVYETGAEQTVGLLNGDLKVGVAGTPEFQGQIESGELRALAVTSPERFTDAPWSDVPTVLEAGYDVTLGNWRLLYGPKDMPDYAVEWWRNTLEKLVQTEAWEEAARNNQWTTTFNTGDDLQKLIDDTYKQIEDAYRATGVISR